MSLEIFAAEEAVMLGDYPQKGLALAAPSTSIVKLPSSTFGLLTQLCSPLPS
jgi:hypothetical protein